MLLQRGIIAAWIRLPWLLSHFKYLIKFESIEQSFQCLQSIPLGLDVDSSPAATSAVTVQPCPFEHMHIPSMESYTEWLQLCLVPYLFSTEINSQGQSQRFVMMQVIDILKVRLIILKFFNNFFKFFS